MKINIDIQNIIKAIASHHYHPDVFVCTTYSVNSSFVIMANNNIYQLKNNPFRLTFKGPNTEEIRKITTISALEKEVVLVRLGIFRHL